MSTMMKVSGEAGLERVVTPMELFFDVVYVFAIGELAHHLLEHVDLQTGAETAILALAVVYAWFMAAWGLNALDPDQPAVRLLVVGLMFASLLMSVSIADAFADRAPLFVASYLALQIGRAAFLIVALRRRALGAHFLHGLVWELSAGVLWVAGAFAQGDARLLLWGLAVAWTQLGVWSLHWLPRRGRALELVHSEIAATHLFERFRLFFIIALGEMILSAGDAFVAERFTLARLAALAIVFTTTVALWWCYFFRAEPAALDALDSTADARALGLRGTWTLALIMLAVIGIAVSGELAIMHPGDDATLGFALLCFGGPALFLIAQLLFMVQTTRVLSGSRLVGLVALSALALITSTHSLIAGIAAAAAVLVSIGAADALPRAFPGPSVEVS